MSETTTEHNFEAELTEPAQAIIVDLNLCTDEDCDQKCMMEHCDNLMNASVMYGDLNKAETEMPASAHLCWLHLPIFVEMYSRSLSKWVFMQALERNPEFVIHMADKLKEKLLDGR